MVVVATKFSIYYYRGTGIMLFVEQVVLQCVDIKSFYFFGKKVGGTWWGAGLACSWALTGGACPRGGQSQSLALGHWGIHSCGGWGGGTWWGTGLAEHLITT